MTPTERILATITASRDTLTFHAWFGRYSQYSSPNEVWHVDLEYKSDVEVKSEGRGKTLDEALMIAWTKLNHVAERGLPSRALSPPVDADAPNYEAEADEEPPRRDLDDEIPF